MKWSKASAVAAQQGNTKVLQTVQLERRKKGYVLLQHVTQVEDIEDPSIVISKRTAAAVIKKLYNVEDWTSPLIFLGIVALANGRLLTEGGTPDIVVAARQVLTDQNLQKIPYFSTPPTVHPSLSHLLHSPWEQQRYCPGAESVGQAQIVTELAKPSTLDGLFGAADAGAIEADTPADAELTDQPEGDEFVEEMDEFSHNEISYSARLTLPLALASSADDLAPHVPRKHSCSRSISPAPSSPSLAESTRLRDAERWYALPSAETPVALARRARLPRSRRGARAAQCGEREAACRSPRRRRHGASGSGRRDGRHWAGRR